MASGALVTLGRCERAFCWKDEAGTTSRQRLWGRNEKAEIWYWKGKLYLLYS